MVCAAVGQFVYRPIHKIRAQVLKTECALVQKHVSSLLCIQYRASINEGITLLFCLVNSQSKRKRTVDS